jgi:hypothetical protein
MESFRTCPRFVHRGFAVAALFRTVDVELRDLRDFIILRPVGGL